MPRQKSQPCELKPLPPPLQAAIRGLYQLEWVGNPHVFDPEYPTLPRDANNKIMAQIARNLLICEEILQFDG